MATPRELRQFNEINRLIVPNSERRLTADQRLTESISKPLLGTGPGNIANVPGCYFSCDEGHQGPTRERERTQPFSALALVISNCSPAGH
jgi:hypothetical protein